MKKFDKCPHYGVGKNIKKEDCDRILYQMTSTDVLRESFKVSAMGMFVVTFYL